MKKRLWLPVAAVVTALALTACLKKGDDVPQCTPNSLTADRQSIDSFIAENDITYLSYNAEGYYQGIANPGTGSTAAADSIVEFKRTISTFNGSSQVTVVTENITTSNGMAIRFSDFQNATASPFYYLMTHAAKGGVLRQILPSSLGYGCQQQIVDGKVIPANSQVVIDIELTTVKKSN